MKTFDDQRIMLELLDQIEQNSEQSHRRLASQLGIALGLANAYMKRSIRKGYVRVRRAPARRYAYFITLEGMREKSRLAINHLSNSFEFFRRARADCLEAFEAGKERGHCRFVLAGISDLGEIASIVAQECGVEIVAVMHQHREPDYWRSRQQGND